MLLFTILQTLPENSSEQLNNAVGQLSKSSIELAEAAANFGVLKVVFGVFMVFFLVMILMFLYQMLSMSKKVSDIHGSCQNVKKIIEDSSSRTLGKPQASILIRRSYNQLAQGIKYMILRTRLEGHLDQREYVTGKVTRFVTDELRVWR